jgi:putative transposase
MTAEIVSPPRKSARRGRELSREQAAAAAMVAEARKQGLELTGPDELLKLLPKTSSRRR